MVKFSACPECGRKNPAYTPACSTCNAPLTHREAQRRRDLRRESELREANGKEPLDVPETDHVAAKQARMNRLERQNVTAAALLGVAVVAAVGLLWAAFVMGWL